MRDLRLAVRALCRQPGFSLLAIVILALGLGATITTFSLVNASVLRPLPFADPDRLMRVTETVGDRSGYAVCSSQFLNYRAFSEVFESMAALEGRHTSLSTPGEETAGVWSLLVTADFFPMLGVQPLLGRTFLPEEDQPGRDRVVVLSHQLWQRHFGGDPQVVGQSVRLGDETVTVVGVMPAAFNDPVRAWTRVDLWRPMALPPRAFTLEGSRGLQVVARLKPGITRSQAKHRMRTLAAQLDSKVSRSLGFKPLAAKPAINDDGHLAVWMTLALATLVLLIACINLAGIQLARLSRRSQERAVRVALGASRGRLVREALTESLLLSLAGGALGFILAAWCVEPIASRLVIGGTHTTVGIPVAIDGRVVIFASVMILGSALIVGTAPIWLASRGPIFDSLRTGRGTTGAGHGRARQVLVAVEMALAVILLASGTMLLAGLERFASADPGWKVDGLVTGRIGLEGARYSSPEARAATIERVRRRLAVLPGVQAVAMSDWVPVSGRWGPVEMWVEGRPRPVARGAVRGYPNDVSPEYFATVGIPLRTGRLLRSDDARPGGTPVAVINESAARMLWPDRSPLGQRLSLFFAENPQANPQWLTIVGVVGDIEYRGSLDDPQLEVQLYEPLGDDGVGRRAAFAVRAPAREEAVVPALVRAVAEVDPQIAVREVMPARTLLEQNLANFMLTGWVMSALAAIGLLLAGLGVYGLFSSFVVERTREIGVRLALGAQRREVLSLIMRRGFRLALVGGMIGTAGALMVIPVLRSIASGIAPPTATTVLALPLALVSVALFACWLPARRAAAVSPMTALRNE